MSQLSKRRMRIRLTLAGLGILIMGLAIFTFWPREQDFYALAQKAYQQGEEARQRDDLGVAKKAYEKADANLTKLFAMQPDNGRGLVLRYHVLSMLYAIVSREEVNQGLTGDNLPSNELVRKATEALAKAMADPNNGEAQGIALAQCFVKDDMELAVQFAERVLRTAEQNDYPNYLNYQFGARYVLAWNLLRGSSPQPDEALVHLHESKKMENPPRWRCVALEAKALAIKAEREKRGAPSRLQTRDKEPVIPDAAAKELQRSLAAGIERVRRELDALPTTANESPTNRRGIFDFLELSVDHAADAREVQEHTALALTVYEKCLGMDKPRADLLTEVAGRVARLPALLSRLPANKQLKPDEIAVLAPRIEKLALQAVDVSPQAAPGLCLELAHNARRNGLLQVTAQFARRGLELAASQRVPDDDPVLLQLHAEVLWVLALQGAPQDQIAPHLDLLRKHFRVLADAKGMLIEGVLALRDGRLEGGVHRLEMAQKDPSYGTTMYPSLALAYGYLATGAYDKAQGYLEKLQEPLKDFEQLREAERSLALQYWPDRAAFLLDLFRCYLYQGQLDKAALANKDLAAFPAHRLTAATELINALIARGWDNWSAGRTKPAREMFDNARDELDTIRPQAGGDPRIVWAEVNLLLHRHAANLTAPAEAVRKAEQVVRSAALQGANADSALPLVRWLIYRKRLAEAEEVLARQKPSGQPSPGLQVLRAQLAVARGQTTEEADAVERIAELLEAKEQWMDDPALLGTGVALSRYEQAGLQFYVQGITAQARGDYTQAARSYERALPYVRFQAAARRGLLSSLSSFSAKSPREAGELTADLLSRLREEPVLLLSSADAAARLDMLDVMEKQLRTLEEVFSRRKQDKALGAYFLARAWQMVGRSDRARHELERALKAQAANAAVLELAARLAIADDDWKNAYRYSHALAELRPDFLEARQWEATADDHLGRRDDAARLCQEIIIKNPDGAAGYAGLVGVLERNRDFANALRWAKRWRERLPQDPEAFRAVVHVMALSGQDAATFVNNEVKSAAPARKLAVTHAAAQGFLDAHAYNQAAHWAAQALSLAGQRAEGDAPRDTLPLELLLGEAYNRNGDPDKALNVYQAIWKKYPGHVAAGMNLAWLLNQRPGQSEAAFQILEQLRRGRFSQKPISGDRLSLEFLNVLGTVYRDARHFKEVTTILEEARERYKDEPLIYLQLGRAYAGRNRLAEAGTALEQAVRLAEKRARGARDAESRSQWLALATEARNDLSEQK